MGTQKRVVKLLRSGNRLVVDPTTPRLLGTLAPHLSYTEKRFFQGMELAMRRRAHQPPFEEILWECYAEDLKGRIATSYGFHDRIKTILTEKGYEVQSRWATKQERIAHEERLATVYKPRWDRIDEIVKNGFEFRYKQRRALELMAMDQSGRIDCPPGWGKGTLIWLLCALFPKARIAVVTKRVPVMNQRLYPELSLNLPSVGIVGGGRRITGRRVMCYTAGSLHHAKGDEDIVLVDEGHEAGADDFASKMGIFEHARVWMFSASWDMRLDNKDMRCEAMSGPIRLKVPYKMAAKHGMVVPIEVVWSDVISDENPCGDLESGTHKKRAGIWANEYRNKIIARDARYYGPNTQVLITVETLEHALYLQRELPDFTVVYGGQGLKDHEIKWFQEEFPDEYRPMSERRKQKLTKRFEQGKLKKVIATTVWNVGVNFKHLEVLIRADGGGSPINDTQIPGRASRINAKLEKGEKTKKKAIGIVHDYRDQFDTGYSYRAKSREKSYKRNEWKQHFPRNKKKSLLRQLMRWGESAT